MLREDWKRSIELSTNIIYIFFCFSTYSQFHNIVVEYRVRDNLYIVRIGPQGNFILLITERFFFTAQIGSLCMEIVECELHRYDEWRDDMEKRRRQFETTTGLVLFPSGNADNSSDKKIKLTDDIWNCEGPLDYEVKRRSDEMNFRVSEAEVKRMKEELEKSRKRFKSLTRKQEQLLRGERRIRVYTR